MNKAFDVVNTLLVELFNDILYIEEAALKKGPYSDLSMTEMHTLEAIGLTGGRTMTEVASDLNITVGTLTTAINKLLNKQYVSRSRIEEDRRVVKIKLTEKGEAAFKLHEKFHFKMTQAALSVLDENDEVVLIRALERLNTFFKNMSEKV